MKEEIVIQLLKIRYFEESLDGLFEKGEIFGTYHRCIGQEATAIGFTHSLDRENDFVVSNHRNHGHYLAFTGDYRGLLDELKGKKCRRQSAYHLSYIQVCKCNWSAYFDSIIR